MPISTLEAVDLLRFADLIADRLGAAQADLAKKRGLEREKEWLAQAARLVDEAREPAKGLVDKARGLAELADLREEFAGALQNAWVDALEKLLAGITFHVSSRSPIIEALFPHQKLPTLRKASREVAAKFNRDFEKRAKSGYVSRMLAGDDFAFAVPVLEQIRAAWAEYEGCFSGAGLPEEEAAPLRAALVEAGQRAEVAVRQAKLLAEAALVPVEGAFEASGLAQKLKKRSAKLVEVASAAPAASADDDASMEPASDADAEEAAAEAEAAADEAHAAATSSPAPDAASSAAEAPAPDAAAAAQAEAGAEPSPAPAPKAPRKKRAPKQEAAAVPQSETPAS